MLLVEKIFIKALSIENYTLFLQRPNLKGKDDIERWRLLTLVFGFIERRKFNLLIKDLSEVDATRKV